jgi:hypothetical protein
MPTYPHLPSKQSPLATTQVCQCRHSFWKHCWNIFTRMSHAASLEAVIISSANWNRHPHSFCIKQGMKKKLLYVMSGVAKLWPVVFPPSLGQAQSDVQGHCCIATTSSSSTKAQDANSELNCIDGKNILIAMLVYSHSFWDEFHVYDSRWVKKTVRALPCLLTYPVVVSSFLAMLALSRWPTVASVADHTENTMFHQKCSYSHHVSLVSQQSEHYSVTWDMLRPSHRILRQGPLLIPAKFSVSSSFMWSPQWYLEMTTCGEAPHYAVLFHSVTSCPVGPHDFPRTLISDSLNIYPSLWVRD